MTSYRTTSLLDGLAFPEGPRWHNRAFWFTDQHARRIYRLADTTAEVIAETEDLPGGLGWLPDGSLLVVYMTRRQVIRLHDNQLTLYADLGDVADFHCNDMLVDTVGRVYVGNFGFDLHGGATQKMAKLVMVDTDGQVKQAAEELLFPNGCVIMPKQNQLIVAETFAHRLSAFTLSIDGNLSHRQTWAELGDVTPDGICLDADGAIWVASPGTGELIRFAEGGQRLDTCQTIGTPYACMLGGDDRRTLFVCTSETDDPDLAASQRSGRIEQVRVPVAGSGLP